MSECAGLSSRSRRASSGDPRTLWLEQAAGRDATRAGLLMTPAFVVAAVISAAAARLRRLRPPLGAVALAAVSAGLHARSPLWLLVVLSVMFGLQNGLNWARTWTRATSATAAWPGTGAWPWSAGGPARSRAPNTVCSTDADIDEVLSALLNEPVTLTATPPPGASLDRAVPEAVLRDGIKAQVPAELIEIGAGATPGTFVDFAPLHLLTTATLDRIAELSPYQGDAVRVRAASRTSAR
jgi:hypothetical protein